jgi:hypothetical protein
VQQEGLPVTGSRTGSKIPPLESSCAHTLYIAHSANKIGMKSVSEGAAARERYTAQSTRLA